MDCKVEYKNKDFEAIEHPFFVYKITCEDNGKVYIGITSRTVEERWQEHVYAAYHEKDLYHQPFKAAIRSHGAENFNVEIIDIKSSWEEACEAEKENIKKYNSFVGFDNPQGYNATLGGDGAIGLFDKKVNKYDVDGNFIEQLPSLSEAARQAGKTPSQIHSSCNGEKKAVGGFYYTYSDEPFRYTKEELEQHKRQREIAGDGSEKRAVAIYSGYTGEKYIEVDSVSEAARICDADVSNVVTHLKGKTPKVGNVIMRYVDEGAPDFVEVPENKREPRMVVKIDGDQVTLYRSLSQAKDENDISYNRIFKQCEENDQEKIDNFTEGVHFCYAGEFFAKRDFIEFLQAAVEMEQRQESLASQIQDAEDTLKTKTPERKMSELSRSTSETHQNAL